MFTVKDKGAMESFQSKAKKKIKSLVNDPSSAQALDFPESKRVWAVYGLDDFDNAYEEYKSAKKGESTDKYLEKMNEAISKLLAKRSKYQNDYEYLIEVSRVIAIFFRIIEGANKVKIDTGESEEA